MLPQKHRSPLNPTLVVYLVLGITTGATAQEFRSATLEGRLHFALGPTYNRIEGLPLTFGPIFQTRNEYPLRFSALAIIRTENDPQSNFNQVGFLIGAEKDLGSHVAIGASGWSRLKWMGDRGLSNLESSASTLVFHADPRDYYDALGAGVHARFHTLDDRFTGIITFRHERHRSVGSAGASSILNNRSPWRVQPLSAEGAIHSMLATVGWDDRPEQRDGPFNGWFAELEVLLGLSGTYRYPQSNDVLGNPFQNSLVADTKPVRTILDVRRYFGIGDIEFNLRAAGGGSLTDRPLTTQYQIALGGPGTLLGVPAFYQDCGARGLRGDANTAVTLVPTRVGIQRPFNPYYGCDRYVLLQAEIAGYFGFAIASEGQRGNAFRGPSGLNFRLIPQWVLFADAGQAWSNLDGAYSTVRDEEMVYDVGGGIVFGTIGAYAAYPLNLDDAKPRFTIRLRRRI